MWSNIILTKGKTGEDGEPDLNDHPPSRYKHCGVLVPSVSHNSSYDLYMFGGRSGTFPLKDFWRLDLKHGKWEELKGSLDGSSGDWPPHLQEHSMVYYSGNIYVFGGEISLSYGEDLSPLWIFNVEKRAWRRWGCPKENQPYPPSSSSDPSSSSSASSKGWMMRGKDKKKFLPQLKSPEMRTPLGRRGHTGNVWRNYMLVYGGYRDLKGSLGELWAFHFESESWHLFSSPELHSKKNSKPWYFFSAAALLSSTFPVARHSHVSVVYRDCLYIHGGMQDLNELQDLWKCDLQTRQWTQIRTKTKFGPGPLHGHVGVVALDSLLIMAGDRGGKAVDEFWRFDFQNEGWDKIVLNGCRPCPRVWAWGTILPMVFKKVKGNGNGNHHYGKGAKYKLTENGSPSGSVDENKYWWDYDESLATHQEEEDEDDQPPKAPNPNSEDGKRRPSLFSDFARFTYNNGPPDYQALSESNSVLDEEHGIGQGSSPGKVHGLNSIQESESHASAPVVEPSLIDLGDDNETNDINLIDSDNTPPSEEPRTDPTYSFSSGISPDDTDTDNDNSNLPLPPLAFNKPQLPSSTRRSESANCLQLNNTTKKNSVKKSASVRFADMMEPSPSTSSSTQFMIPPRECTSDYSSMEHGLNLNGRNNGGFENPNYNNKLVEAFELGAMSPGAGAVVLEEEEEEDGKTTNKISTSPMEPSASFHYQVQTPNYMLLIGGNEFHSSHVVSRKQPLAIWRLRVTRDLFGSGGGGTTNPSSSSSGPSSLPSNMRNNDPPPPYGSGRPSSAGQAKKLTTTGF